MHLFSDLKNC